MFGERDERCVGVAGCKHKVEIVEEIMDRTLITSPASPCSLRLLGGWRGGGGRNGGDIL